MLVEWIQTYTLTTQTTTSAEIVASSKLKESLIVTSSCMMKLKISWTPLNKLLLNDTKTNSMLVTGEPTPTSGCSQKLTQDKREFWINFCNFSIRFFVYIICPSVLSFCDVKLHKTYAVENIFIEGKLVPRLIFNHWLALTAFWTNQPWISRTELLHIKRSFSWAGKIKQRS